MQAALDACLPSAGSASRKSRPCHLLHSAQSPTPSSPPPFPLLPPACAPSTLHAAALSSPLSPRSPPPPPTAGPSPDPPPPQADPAPPRPRGDKSGARQSQSTKAARAVAGDDA
ncbi:hypothetical protein BS78_07G101700 [Paspalum vaginatum]|nr:hypothetical protein BS78_07G101700 [Paspalum vaginatum]